MSEFIETLAPFAIKYGGEAGVLPSLIIAQGILESGSGTSHLAVNTNNLFGIKKGAGWDGEVFEITTSEYKKNDEGIDEIYYIKAEFRKYPSYEGAVIDLCEKYTQGLTWETHNRYQAVIGETDFETAAQAVKDAGYATDPVYPQKLVAIYKSHDLGKYDPIKEETTMRVVIDAGHGINTPGKRTPAGEREWSFNNVVALACIAELRTYEGIEILRVDDATGNTDVALATRTARANSWKGTILVSIHHNANTGVWGTWTGVETYVMSPASANPASMRLAQAVHPRLVAAMGLRDRGIKAANFHMLREAKMPGILTEGGYMDSTIDIQKMRNQAVLRNAGIAIAQGVAVYGNLKKRQASAPATTSPVSSPNLFRVRKSWADAASQLGAYSVLNTAIDLAKRNEGYSVYDHSGKLVFPVPVVTPPAPQAPTQLFRVRKTFADAGSQIGAFADLEGAVALADQRKDEGFLVFDGDGKLVHNPPKYAIGTADRIGEAEVVADTAYLTMPIASSHRLRTLPKGHGAGGKMHIFEVKGAFTRAGIGWIATKDIKVTRNYASDKLVENFVEEAAKQGVTPNTSANKTRLHAEITKLL